MKKSTLNAIMQGVIIVLIIAIVVVSIKLITRPEVTEPSEVAIAEKESEAEPEVIPEVESEEPAAPEVYTRVRILKDNINVRSGPGTEYDRLGSAYGGYDFEFLEVVNDEWTKIIYDGKEAYVYSEYVEVIEMYLNVDGKYIEVPKDLSSESVEGDATAEEAVSTEEETVESAETTETTE